MKNLYINPATNDIEMDAQNNFKMVDGDDELVQSVSVAFKTAKGSWFLNPEHGFNRAVVQTKVYNETIVTDELYETALQDDRVNHVNDITYDYDKQNRKLSVDFNFTKQNGETVEGGV